MSIHTVPSGPEHSLKMAGKYVPLSIKVFLVYVSTLCTKYKIKQLSKSLEAKFLLSLDMTDMKMQPSKFSF